MSDMETARKAGGNRSAFTVAVLVAITVTLALFVLKLLQG
jgi:hypothetical protein